MEFTNIGNSAKSNRWVNYLTRCSILEHQKLPCVIDITRKGIPPCFLAVEHLLELCAGLLYAVALRIQPTRKGSNSCLNVHVVKTCASRQHGWLRLQAPRWANGEVHFGPWDWKWINSSPKSQGGLTVEAADPEVGIVHRHLGDQPTITVPLFNPDI